MLTKFIPQKCVKCLQYKITFICGEWVVITMYTLYENCKGCKETEFLYDLMMSVNLMSFFYQNTKYYMINIMSLDLLLNFQFRTVLPTPIYTSITN